VHTPVEAKPEYVEYFKAKPGALTKPVYHVEQNDGGKDVYVFDQQGHPEYAGMLKSLDDSVGRIQACLKELGLDENTVVVFTADQGPLSIRGSKNHFGLTSSFPLRGGKGHLYEGGVRVPLLVKDPRGQRGAVSEVVTVNTDWYPTMLALTGLDPDPAQHIDGVSIAPSFAGEDVPFDRPFFWAYPAYHSSGTMPSVGMMRGSYKLIYFLDTQHVELYDVLKDVSEKTNLASALPEVAERMKTELLSTPYVAKVVTKHKPRKK
jgi:arylsulfatase A-like enzyme